MVCQNGFTYGLQSFLLISDCLGCVNRVIAILVDMFFSNYIVIVVRKFSPNIKMHQKNQACFCATSYAYMCNYPYIMAGWLAGRMAALKELHSTKSHYLLESAIFKGLSGQTLSQQYRQKTRQKPTKKPTKNPIKKPLCNYPYIMAGWLACRMAALKELHSTKSHYLLESAMLKRLSGQSLSQQYRYYHSHTQDIIPPYGVKGPGKINPLSMIL